MLFPSNFITRKVATPIFTRTRRMFSAGGSHEEHVAEVDRWYKLTIVMIGVSLIGAGYNVVFHSHEHVRTGLPYQKMRTKPFPWSCPDCDMFDLNCFAECKAAKNAK